MEGAQFGEPMYLLPTKDFYPFHTWCMDLITNKNPPRVEREKQLLVAIDAFSKWIEIGTLRLIVRALQHGFIRNHPVTMEPLLI